jgi:hypothetical protein
MVVRELEARSVAVKRDHRDLGFIRSAGDSDAVQSASITTAQIDANIKPQYTTGCDPMKPFTYTERAKAVQNNILTLFRYGV